jgi:hypothetical protein
MLGHPCIPRYRARRQAHPGDNALGAGHQQGRPGGRDGPPEPSETARRTSASDADDDTVRSAWRQAEAGRNDRPLGGGGIRRRW